MNLSHLKSGLLFFAALSSDFARDARGQECVDLAVDQNSYCEPIRTWVDFVRLVDDSVPGDELYLCPFDIVKDDGVPVSVSWGIKIVCVSSSPTDRCNFQASGTVLLVETGDDTLFQGLTFRDGDDHVVHITSGAEGASEATHTFCSCRFTGNSRMLSSRGGAFMTQSNAGTVNLIYCFFERNFSMSRGAAIYTRTNQMNIIDSSFSENSALQWGGAIYCSGDAGLYVEGSTFDKNIGQQDYGTVVQPRDGPSVWIDGGNNLSTNESCNGFYLIADGLCQEFTEREPTKQTSDIPSEMFLAAPNSPAKQSSVPSEGPFERPSLRQSVRPLLFPSISPSAHASSSLSELPSSSPSKSSVGNVLSYTPTHSALELSSVPTPILVDNVSSTEPTTSVEPSPAPFSLQETICTFDEGLDPCIEVETFEDLQSAILGGPVVNFCGGFNMRKPENKTIELSTHHDIRCALPCTLYGRGTHVEVSGPDSQVRIHNIKFMLSNSSAVRVVTTSRNATTTLCGTEFWRNKAHFGGALFIERDSGYVNIVGNIFTNNEAMKGGAIYGDPHVLNVLESRFVSNVATRAGSAIFALAQAQVFIRSTYFAFNTVVQNLNFPNNYDVVVEAGDRSEEGPRTGHSDAGENTIVASGDCKGFFVKSHKICNPFGGHEEIQHSLSLRLSENDRDAYEV